MLGTGHRVPRGQMLEYVETWAAFGVAAVTVQVPFCPFF